MTDLLSEITFCDECPYSGEPNGCNREEGICKAHESYFDLVEENAALRERLDKAVELEAKVGDTVYMPWVYDGVSDIAKSHICSIIMDSETVTYAVDFIADLGDAEKGFVEKYKHGQFTKKDFGKIVFTDYTEAEARLKEIVEEA